MDLPNCLEYVNDRTAFTSATLQAELCSYSERNVKVCIDADETIEGKVL